MESRRRIAGRGQGSHVKFVLCLLMGLIPCYGYAARGSSKISGPAVGTIAPDFDGRNILTGDRIPLSSQRGKIVNIVTFWASWCAPCRRELPILDKALRVVGQDRLSVIAVSFRESTDAIRAIKKMAAEWHINFIDDSSGAIARHYSIEAIPHLFMIDRTGKVVANHTGYGDSSLQVLVKDLNRTLISPPDEPTGSPPATGELTGCGQVGRSKTGGGGGGLEPCPEAGISSPRTCFRATCGIRAIPRRDNVAYF